MRPALVAALLILPLAAGCLDGLLGGGSTSATITRVVVVHLDAQSMADLEDSEGPEDAFEAATTTEFVYTHSGSNADPDDLTVTYTDNGGDEVEKPLSDFTDRDAVGDGDKITIRGASPYSGITITGSGVDAERGGADHDWLRAAGYPLPLAIEPGAEAAWTGDLAVAYGLTFDHFRYESTSTYEYEDCYNEETYEWDPDNCETVVESDHEIMGVDDFSFIAEYGLEGLLTLTGSGSGDETIVDLNMEGDATLSATGRAFVEYVSEYVYGDEVDGEEWSGPAGFDGEVTATGDTLTRLIFQDGELQRVGASASYGTQGRAVWWGENYTEEDPYEPFADEDWPAVEVEYEEEDLDLDDEDSDAEDIALMERFWNMDLVPGDRFEFLLEVDEEGVDIRLALTVAVGALQDLTVEAGTFPALRIESSVQLDMDLDGTSPQHLEFDGMTHWVHADTYLPLRISAQVQDEIPAEDIEAMLADLAALLEDEGSSVELPTEIEFTTSFAGDLELTELDGDVRMPGLLSGLGLWAPYAVAAFGVYGFTGGYGYDDDYEYDECYEYDEYGSCIEDDCYDYYCSEDPPAAEEIPPFPAVEVKDAANPLTEAAWFEKIVTVKHLGGDRVYPGDYYWYIDGVVVNAGDCLTGSWSTWGSGQTICLTEASENIAPGEVTLTVEYYDFTVVYETTLVVA